MRDMSAQAGSGSETVASSTEKARRQVDVETFEPIDQLRAHEYVAEQLRRQIALHLVPVGGALPSERELSAVFGVGRATVQAAIRLLEAERLVETRRGRHGGTFVIGQTDEVAKDYLLVRLRRDRERIAEALVFRRNVDTFAARLAATERSADELAQIELANARALDSELDAEFMASDTEFHLAIARASHNDFVYEAVEQMRLVLNDAISALPESRLWKRRTDKEHATILDALRRRQPTEAAKAMERHAASTEKSVNALLAAL
jgi:GntR family transcriptional regulator, transcriptional repressor for pyruvate dehydrogenase complex